MPCRSEYYLKRVTHFVGNTAPLIPDVRFEKVLDSLAVVVQEDGGAQAAKVVVGVQRSDAGHLNARAFHCVQY